MDHKQSTILIMHIKIVNLLVNDTIVMIVEWLCASVLNTPIVFETAGCADGSISKSKISTKNYFFQV